jgi:hypothetical protein
MNALELPNPRLPSPNPKPYVDAPRARDYILALGRIYLDAGLPLAFAIEAALADYQCLGTPAACDN